jgi:hypothetical protein
MKDEIIKFETTVLTKEKGLQKALNLIKKDV